MKRMLLFALLLTGLNTEVTRPAALQETQELQEEAGEPEGREETQEQAPVEGEEPEEPAAETEPEAVEIPAGPQVEGTAPEEPQAEAETAPEEPAEPAAAAQGVSSAGMQFRFEGIPLKTVIDTVMRELGYSYVIDPQVQGTASIYTMGVIPRENAFGVLTRLLQMNGQGIVRQGDLYVIVPLGQTTRIPHQLGTPPQVAPRQPEPAAQRPSEPPEEAAPEPGPEEETPAQETPPPEPVQGEEAAAEPLVSAIPTPLEPEEGEEAPGVVTYVIPLQYIISEEMVKIVTSFVSDGANIINFASANTLIVTDFRENIEQVLKVVNLLDTRYFDLNTVDLIPVRYHQATLVAEDLSQVFVTSGERSGIRIVAIERLNSILVVTHSPASFQEVTRWIEKLDTPSAGTNVKTFVYQVENNTATNIARILAQLYSEGLGAGRPPSEGTGTPPPGRPQEPGFVPSPAFPAQQGQFGGGAGQLGPSLAGRPMSSQAGIQAVVAADVKIIVNEFNNSLIIQATESDYQFLLQTIKQLDVLPRQVLIEAKIYSVELRDELSFGVAAFLEQRNRAADAGPATTGQISAPTEESLGGALGVSTRTIIGAERQLEAAINALRSKTDVEILEAPRVLALDGMQAQINVGAEVPVTTASFGDPLRAGTATSFVNSIQFRPTGTTLLIMPRISASGVVTMDLAIEVSSASGAALTPTINRNFLTTSLIVRDGQTVAIAGIISDQTDFARSRVPLLGDIPILGALFGQTSRNKRRAELIFFITPHVIRNLPTATELTLEFKRALRKAYDFIEKSEKEERELIEKRRQKELTR